MEILTSTSKISIRQIFQDHWQEFLATSQSSISDHIITTVEKMLSCRDPHKLSYHKYVCPQHPDQYIVVPHSCKCRFCNTCGKVLTDKWVKEIESTFPFVPFHHICFTIPKKLRELLQKEKSLETLFLFPFCNVAEKIPLSLFTI